MTLSETLQNETESAEKQYELGIEYYNNQEYSKAVEHFRNAAALGHAEAQYSLGCLYYYGIGVTQNYTEATTWIRKADEEGM